MSKVMDYLFSGSPATRTLAPLALMLTLGTPVAQAATVFINEFHYDNIGADEGEGVELAGSAGLSIDGWQLAFYNGTNGSAYRTEDLAGSFSNDQNGFGFLYFALGGLQNGPDGIALLDSDSNVIEFLSYEGSFVASDGAANGMRSIDIGIEETNTPIGQSLQRIGRGERATDFSWQLQTASPGILNSNQQFATAVPLPASAWLFATALLGLLRGRHR